MTGCDRCGCYLRGRQDEAFDTYRDNIDATVEADYWASHGRVNPDLEIARDQLQRWYDR